MKSSSISSQMVGETIWLVLHITTVAVPIAWRFTEEDAKAARDILVQTSLARGETYVYYVIVPVTNE